MITKRQFTLLLPPVTIDKYNKVVQGVSIDNHGETFAVHSIDFGDKIEADIKIVFGDENYVDAVLFDDGQEVRVLEPADEFDGEYVFHYNDCEYVVIVEAEKYTGEKCPNCGSFDISAGDESPLGATTILRNVTCDECHAQWTETLTVTGFGELMDSEGKPLL